MNLSLCVPGVVLPHWIDDQDNYYQAVNNVMAIYTPIAKVS